MYNGIEVRRLRDDKLDFQTPRRSFQRLHTALNVNCSKYGYGLLDARPNSARRSCDAITEIMTVMNDVDAIVTCAQKRVVKPA